LIIVKKLVLPIILLAVLISGCTTNRIKTVPLLTVTSTPPVTPTKTSIPNIVALKMTETPYLSGYEFPGSIDPSRKYMFYLHGKIVEDQGLNAVSPDYGPYEYEAILQALASYGFIVVSELRQKNSDPIEYANKVVGQAKSLLDGGVSPKNITIIGASKGAEIAILASKLMQNDGVNYVILGACHPDNIQYYKQNDVSLSGNVLSIRESVDELSGSCDELFSFSEGKGLANHNELILQVGTGHGILYKPMDEWVLPTVDWANGK
jgi:hypothetical protein